MKVRRVVTGHDDDGRALIVSDAEVDASGLLGATLWAQDELPTFPNDGAIPETRSYYPPVGGVRFYIASVKPGVNAASGDADVEALIAGNPELLPELSKVDPSGFHTDDSLTCHLVLSGSVTLELDDGAQTTLHAGDVLVQNGTRHRWIGDEHEPATIALFMIGARRAGS